MSQQQRNNEARSAIPRRRPRAPPPRRWREEQQQQSFSIISQVKAISHTVQFQVLMWLLIVFLLAIALRQHSEGLAARRRADELAAIQRAEELARKARSNMYISFVMYGLLILVGLWIFGFLCQNHSTSISTSLNTAASNVAQSNRAAVQAVDAIAARHSASVHAAAEQLDRRIRSAMYSGLDRLEDISYQHSRAVLDSAMYRTPVGRSIGWIESQDDSDDENSMLMERMSRLQEQAVDYERARAVASGVNAAATALAVCCVM